jgi:hypothetical protein
MALGCHRRGLMSATTPLPNRSTGDDDGLNGMHGGAQ